ncbi:MAG: type II secretion system F family protein [Patescibacteria group bacterium]|jgi:type IV pilus assembly protein PilC
MLHFEYKAVKNDGTKVQGLIEAKDQESAVKLLREKKLLVVEIKDQKKSFNYRLLVKFFGVNGDDIVIFTRQLATMIGSGLPIVNALQLLRKRARPAMAEVIDDVSSSVEGGDSLYKALSKHPSFFSPIYLALVKAGEMAGVLDEVLNRLAINLERDRDFKAKVKASMLYPAIVMMAMVVVAIIMVFYVIPKISSLYDEFEAELPLMTEIVLGTAEFIRSKWYIFLIGLVAGIGFLISLLRTEEGKRKIDEYILKIPYLGELQHKIISANIIRTLALLVKSGVSIVESLNVVALAADNYMYEHSILSSAKNVEKGMTLAVSFAQEGVFPEMVVQMINVGEETGKLDDMLDRIAQQFTKDSLLALKALTSAIEPAMIIVLGIGVGIMVISIIVPIYNLTSQF